MLHTDALHVLRPPGEDSPVPIDMGPEGMMGPLRLLHRNDVGVGVEHDRGEARVCAGPFEDDDGLPGRELDRLGLEREGARLGEDEFRRLAVVGLGLGGVDPEIVLEAGDDGGRVLGDGEWP